MDESLICGRPEFGTDLHRQSIAVALQWLETLGNGDMETLMTLWHENGVLEFPFNPEGAGRDRVEGFEDLSDYFQGTKGHKKPIAFPVKAIYPGADPEWLVVEFIGRLLNTKTNQEYSNEYIVVIRVHEGKVILFREFFNSIKRKQFELD
ncbi:nuclear transport factor 2 family protein [Oscillatoriales cyanobacterium LEGE 11467]|uniref:Nuclear transport factor 2 family protein n=1 Tax=Zarconia navalis LEGE 11467 TaxID=1828826 RepID=A0A928Z9G9_9CYAN|nr:nuclear transport factor 2 family protein [Zarconia navalis]MBE9042655.1 nuclear transport factor 2 family protein [Zarconia navalis LEGE 11467]